MSTRAWMRHSSAIARRTSDAGTQGPVPLPTVCCRDAQSTIAFQRDYIARLTSQLRETRIRAGLSEPDDRDAAAAPDAGVLPPWVLDVESMHPLLQAYDARISVRAACAGLAGILHSR